MEERVLHLSYGYHLVVMDGPQPAPNELWHVPQTASFLIGRKD